MNQIKLIFFDCGGESIGIDTKYVTNCERTKQGLHFHLQDSSVGKSRYFDLSPEVAQEIFAQVKNDRRFISITLIRTESLINTDFIHDLEGFSEILAQ